VGGTVVPCPPGLATTSLLADLVILTAAMAPLPMEKPVAMLARMERFLGSLTTRPTKTKLNVMIASITSAIPSVTPGPGKIADICTCDGVSL